MNLIKNTVFSVVALAAISLTPALMADQWNKKTVMTITEAIQLPHTILQPGTYVFKLADSLSDRHIVQIFNADETKIIATILAIPNYRLKPTDKSVFGFWETPAGNPKALRAWFYPGDNFGQEFAYPKMKAVELAQMANVQVPAVLVEKEAVVDVATLKAAPVKIVTAKGEEKPVVMMAQNKPAAMPTMEAAPMAKELPHTGSSLPLIGLAGMVSLIGFAFLSRR